MITAFKTPTDEWIQVAWKITLLVPQEKIYLSCQQLASLKEQNLMQLPGQSTETERLLQEVAQKQVLIELAAQNIPAEVCAYSTQDETYFYSNQYLAKLLSTSIGNRVELEQVLSAAFVSPQERIRFQTEKKDLGDCFIHKVRSPTV